MTTLAAILGHTSARLPEPEHAVAVARHKGAIHWLLSERDNWVLDFGKWRAEFVAAGHQVPPLREVSARRSGIAIVNEDTADVFLMAPEVLVLNFRFLQKALIERFPDAQSWWDVAFLFPVAFIDFDNKNLACFDHAGPQLERYAPDGWSGAFVDFAIHYPEDIFPSKDKFWIVDGRDLLGELNERGRILEATRNKDT